MFATCMLVTIYKNAKSLNFETVIVSSHISEEFFSNSLEGMIGAISCFLQALKLLLFPTSHIGLVNIAQEVLINYAIFLCVDMSLLFSERIPVLKAFALHVMFLLFIIEHDELL